MRWGPKEPTQGVFTAGQHRGLWAPACWTCVGSKGTCLHITLPAGRGNWVGSQFPSVMVEAPARVTKSLALEPLPQAELCQAKPAGRGPAVLVATGVPQKLKRGRPHDPAIPLLGIYPMEEKSRFLSSLHPHVPCSIRHRGQDMGVS